MIVAKATNLTKTRLGPESNGESSLKVLLSLSSSSLAKSLLLELLIAIRALI